MSLPERHGKSWNDDEILELLKGVQKKKNIEELAEIHKRTQGGIKSRLREIAADYYFNENLSLDKIAKFTGLDIEIISDAISRRQYKMNEKEKKIKENINIKPVTTYFTSHNKFQEPKKEDMMSLLSEIRDLLKETLSVLKEYN